MKPPRTLSISAALHSRIWLLKIRSVPYRSEEREDHLLLGGDLNGLDRLERSPPEEASRIYGVHLAPGTLPPPRPAGSCRGRSP